ncbi:cuticle protein 10.9-like [Parasteatoda tepidariorum]|uniref:cuticle protein 10.9-like n=1 Tax=Parasteatoda tepidariorum TaxID=114398 RepID=UPI00077FAEC9|nr:cuticle protein 10.9-like [Parasteatoda tepidariorum]
MKVLVVFAALLAIAYSQGDESPKPYSFSYIATGDEGSSSHSETADGSGTVRGSYSLSDADGRNRVVEYVAGIDGFVANIRTNEPGTDNAAPADVTIESTADGAKAYAAVVKPEPRPQRVRYVLVPATD